MSADDVRFSVLSVFLREVVVAGEESRLGSLTVSFAVARDSSERAITTGASVVVLRLRVSSSLVSVACVIEADVSFTSDCEAVVSGGADLLAEAFAV